MAIARTARDGRSSPVARTDARLGALSNSTRREILRRAWTRERSAGELADGFELTRPAVSQHIKVLLDARLLTVRREGTRRLYRADRGVVRQVVLDLASFWEDHLDRLKRVVESDHEET